MDGQPIWREKTSFDTMEKIVFKTEKDRLDREMTEAELKNAEQIAESDDYDLRTCHQK